MQLEYSYSRPSHNDVDFASRDVVRLAPGYRWLTFRCHGRAAGSSPVVPAFFSVRPSAQPSTKHVNCKLKATLYLRF